MQLRRTGHGALWGLALAAGTASLAGCLDTRAPSTPNAPPTTAIAQLPDLHNLIQQSPGALVVNLDVYQMTVPKGAVSRSDDFWKRVDEQQVDPATYDLLLKNGMRVGIAPDHEWTFFKDILERNNARTQKGTVMAGQTGTVELSMRKNVGTEDVFYLSDHNEWFGQTYDQCENLLAISFWPDLRKAGELHVTVTPVVRARHSRLEFKQNGEEREIVEVRPEHLYDLNLSTVIPPNCFLVIAPSTEGTWTSSLGNRFLVTDGETEQKEHVLVLAPKSVHRVVAPAPRLRGAGPVPTFSGK